MIKLNLSQFGGGSSGGDGLAADQSAFRQITKKEYHGSAGGSGQSSGSGGTRKSSGERITYSKEILERINPNENYTVVRYNYATEKQTRYESMDGEDLMNMLRGFTYDEDEKEWYSDKNENVYRITRRKR